ncbi:MAG: hypothetical protein Q8S42_10820 [Archangium sp.]|nr:hypothetical protein [Archangium sp.]
MRHRLRVTSDGLQQRVFALSLPESLDQGEELLTLSFVIGFHLAHGDAPSRRELE